MRAPTITDPPQQLGQLHGLSPKRVAAVPDIVNKPAKKQQAGSRSFRKEKRPARDHHAYSSDSGDLSRRCAIMRENTKYAVTYSP